MPELVYYLFKFSVCLAISYLFYRFFLRRLTFFGWNRFYLLFYSLLSLFIPFADIGQFVEKPAFRELRFLTYIPPLGAGAAAPSIRLSSSLQRAPWTPWDFLLLFLAAGALVMVGRMIIQLISIQQMKKKSRILGNSLASTYAVDQLIIPFSFGQSIFVNPALHSEKELQEIILHEYVHIRQGHTWDVLFGELLCIVNWFNPFAWLLRHAIRQNLEFIADDRLIRQGVDRKAYQYHLLKVVGTPLYQLANSFNLPSLKKRIAMMNTLRSARGQLLKFLFLLPLLGILMLAFRNRHDPSKDSSGGPTPSLKFEPGGSRLSDIIPAQAGIYSKQKWIKMNPTDTVPLAIHPQIHSLSLYRDDAMDEEHRNFFRLNGSVTLMRWILDPNDLEIYLKNGTVESYRLNQDWERRQAENKYGPLPSAVAGSYKEMHWRIAENNNPLVIVDGKPTRIDLLNHTTIESIYVSKQLADTQVYGESAKSGVVYLTTKTNAAENAHFRTPLTDVVSVFFAASAHLENGMTELLGSVRIGLKYLDRKIPVFYAGRAYDIRQFNLMYTNQVFDTVFIYDGPQARYLFGEQAKDGAIVIGSFEESPGPLPGLVLFNKWNL
jgi:hypothetical protein